MKTKRLRTLVIGIIVCGAAVTSSYATLLGSDSFNYSTGSIVGDGTADSFWGSAWACKTPGSSAVVSPGLSYTDGNGTAATTSGNAFSSIGTSSTTNPQRYFGGTMATLSGATATANSGTIWMSFLWQGLNTSASGSLFRQASVGFYQGMTSASGSGSEYLDVGMPNISASTVATVLPNVSVWYGGKGISSSSSSTAPAINNTIAANGGNTIFAVLEFQMDNVTTTADTLTMWLNPNLSGTSPSGTSYTFSAQDLSSINGIRVAAGNINSTYGTIAGEETVDEIYFGTTFADVIPVPEPGVLSLVTMGGLLALARRRK
jgi:hypothetical protein